MGLRRNRARGHTGRVEAPEEIWNGGGSTY
jgi:hypothetical protein